AAAPITAGQFAGQVAPGQASSLLYGKFTPSVAGTGVATLNDYNINTVDSLGFADWLCPDIYAGIPGDPTWVMHARAMANIIGVLPGDYDLANSSTGVPCSAPLGPQAGTFDRSLPFLNKTITLYKQQTKDNLFHGNEASVRLDWNPREKDRLFTGVN